MPNAVVPIRKIKAVIVMAAKKVQSEKIFRYADKKGIRKNQSDRRPVLTTTGKHASGNSDNDRRDKEKDGESNTRFASDAYPALNRKYDKRFPPDERKYGQ